MPDHYAIGRTPLLVLFESGFVNHTGNDLARREMQRPFVPRVSAKVILSLPGVGVCVGVGIVIVVRVLVMLILNIILMYVISSWKDSEDEDVDRF